MSRSASGSFTCMGNCGVFALCCHSAQVQRFCAWFRCCRQPTPVVGAVSPSCAIRNDHALRYGEIVVEQILEPHAGFGHEHAPLIFTSPLVLLHAVICGRYWVLLTKAYGSDSLDQRLESQQGAAAVVVSELSCRFARSLVSVHAPCQYRGISSLFVVEKT